jgi:2-hydroxychromene-2-carboxylate isomerase
MPASIDAFFEFASPYSYLAAQELPALAARHGRPIRWRPIELAKVWEEQGVLEAYKAVRRAKGRYVMRDAARVAADRGVRFVPFGSLPNATAARLVVHRLNRCAPAAAQPFLLEVWRKLFAEGADIGSSEVLACCLDPHLHPEIELAQSDTQATRTWRAPMAYNSTVTVHGFLATPLDHQQTLSSATDHTTSIVGSLSPTFEHMI